MKNGFLSTVAVVALSAAVGGGVGYVASQNNNQITKWCDAIGAATSSEQASDVPTGGAKARFAS
ncbi:MAG: hypothetical protein IKV60_03395, partial [Rikenellaceae bacterium]|nr:hypothetical protein [Rikenellaceae bacterium]